MRFCNKHLIGKNKVKHLSVYNPSFCDTAQDFLISRYFLCPSLPSEISPFELQKCLIEWAGFHGKKAKTNFIFSCLSVSLISTVIPHYLFWKNLGQIPSALAIFRYENVQWRLVAEHQSSPISQSYNFSIGQYNIQTAIQLNFLLYSTWHLPRPWKPAVEEEWQSPLPPCPSSLLYILFHSLAASIAEVWKWCPSAIADVWSRLFVSRCAFAGFWGFSTSDSSFFASYGASSLADCFWLPLHFQRFISQLYQPSRWSSWAGTQAISLPWGPSLRKCASLLPCRQDFSHLFLDPAVPGLLASHSFSHLPISTLNKKQVTVSKSPKFQGMWPAFLSSFVETLLHLA